MSRHLEILRKAKLDAELFACPVAADKPYIAPRRRAPATGVCWSPDHSHDQWQQLVHQIFLRRGPEVRDSVGLASATAGEGTSYVAFHLAVELARSTRQPTLLLEANLYRPAQAERLGVEGDPGVRQVLEKKSALDDSLHPTAVEQLWLLPSGSAPNGSGGAPDWGGFRRVFQSLRERFAGLVVDLPPINLSTDSVIIGPSLGGVVLVVEADLCSREVIQNAVARLRRANPNVMGTILNKRKFVIPAPLYRRL